MSKINDTTDYPVTVPAAGDMLIGTDVSNTSTDAGGETANFTVAGLTTHVESNMDALRNVALVNALATYAPTRAEALLLNVPAAQVVLFVRSDVGLLAYKSDPAGTALTTAGGRKWSPDGKAYANHWGVDTTGAADCITAITAGLLYVSTQGDKTLNFLAGTYYHSTPIVYPFVTGVQIIGTSVPASSSMNMPVRFTCDQATGAQVRLTHSNQTLKGVEVHASGTRQRQDFTAGAFGVLIERDEDLSIASIAQVHIEEVYITKQSGHALVSSGAGFMHKYIGVVTRENKGHAITVSDGTLTGRTNIGRSGGYIIEHQRAFNDQGYLIKLGDRGTYGVYRFTLIDCDSSASFNRNDAISPNAAVMDIHGENITISNYALGGGNDAGSSYAGAYVSGRNISFNACRYIDVTSYAILFDEATIGVGEVEINLPYATNSSTLNPGVVATAGARTSFINLPSEGTGGKKPVTPFSAAYTKGIYLDNSEIAYGAHQVKSRGLFHGSADGTVQFRAERANAVSGFEVVRTGSGAVTGGVFSEANTLRFKTSTENDLQFSRNNVTRMSVKATTINIVSLPTSTAGLTVGDLWNNSGVVSVV